MSRLIKTLAKPITAPVAACTARVARMDEPLKRHIDAAEANGEDPCAKVWREFVEWQVKLAPYRWEKFVAECSQLGSGRTPISELCPQDAILFGRFATTCFFLFIAFVMVGRRSVFPPLEPGSPFVEEVMTNWNVNHINALPNEPRESVHFLFVNAEQFPEDLTPMLEEAERAEARKKGKK